MNLETYRKDVNKRITEREDISNGKGGRALGVILTVVICCEISTLLSQMESFAWMLAHMSTGHAIPPP